MWTTLCRSITMLLLLCGAANVDAADYYVSNQGDDANPGTLSSPFRTLARGVSGLKPGDTLLVRAGTYVGSSQLRHIPSGESWERPVTINAFPGERPVIVPEPRQTVMYITGTQYVVINGLLIDAKGGHDGIKITYVTGGMQAQHIRIQNCEVKNASNQGLLVAGEGNEFINLDVHDNGTTGLHHGIYLSADRNLIDGGKYYRNAGWGVHVYPKATNTIVRNVRSFDNRGAGIGLVWGANNRAYNNLVYGNGSGIHLSGDSPRCYNNTIYGNRGEGLSIANAQNGPRGTRKADVRNNIMFRNGSGIRDYAVGTGTVLSNNLEDDPRFVDAAAGDFRLQAGSAAINKGADLHPEGVTTDIQGTSRPQGEAFDIGAHEFTPSPAVGASRPVVPADRFRLGGLLPLLLGVSSTTVHPIPAKGPLRVHPENPRYFTNGTEAPDGSLLAVYLTGAHTWNNLVDIGRSDPPEKFDFTAYLDFLERHHHNFIRLWAWDSTTWDTRANGALGKDFIHNAAPLPWARTGPGNALDGKPRFDLTKFEPEYFERLRARVQAAGERGIYVGVMFFEGWGLMHGNRRRNTEDGWAWRSHPFNLANNINNLTIEGSDALSGRVHTLRNPEANRLQAAYLRKVVDTVNDLDNVLYEVINEGGEQEWNWWVIRTVQEYQQTKPKQHPIGNTGHGAERLASMLASPADWISPGRVDGFAEDPPAWNEKKVSLLDTDHIWGVGGNATWVWRSFLRGHNPIFMDPYDGSVLGQDPGWEPLRAALGHTRRLAERVNLAAMTPQDNLASTGYCLAHPGREYLVYQPRKNEAFSVELQPGTYLFECFDPAKGTIAGTGRIEASGGRQQFKPPTAADAVLYLKKAPQLSKDETNIR